MIISKSFISPLKTVVEKGVVSERQKANSFALLTGGSQTEEQVQNNRGSLCLDNCKKSSFVRALMDGQAL